MKRISLIILVVAAIIAGSVSCQKVNDIDKRLTQLEQTVSDLKAQVLAGAVITSVDKTADGCTFVLSNGESYTVTNGKNGTDGEAIIADVKIEENFVVLTLKDGETLRISYQNPLSIVTLTIVPDYTDGTVKNYSPKNNLMYLSVEVTPAKYAEALSDTSKFIHKAVFSPVQTKGGFGEAFTITPKDISYNAGAPIPFLELCLELDEMSAWMLDNGTYAVSCTIEDKEGVNGVSTAFVPISYEKGSGEGGGQTDNAVPAGALPGKFTVNNDGKQVYFSKGNLWYGKVEGIEEKTFNFEANQWGFSSEWNENHVSHFYWTKVALIAYSIKFNTGYHRTTSDIFFTNGAETSAKSDFTVNGVTGKYRTLSKDECDYLFNKRTVNGGTKEGKSYQIATINSDVSGGVYGVILYPDGYTAQTSGTSYTSADWAAMEAAGCVFLPAAGQRAESVLSSVNKNIYYWLSSAFSVEFAYAFKNNGTNVSNIMNSRNLCCSVRLVTDCQ